MLMENAVILLICFSYQYIDHSWHTTMYIALAVTSVSLVICLTQMRESPKFFYNVKRYDDARRSLNEMAVFNG